MGKLIWMTPPTLILLFSLNDAFNRLQAGHVDQFIMGLIIMGGLSSIVWFVAYRFFTMK